MIRRSLAIAALASLPAALVAAPAATAAPTVAIAGDSIGDESRAAVRAAIEPTHRIAWYVTRDSATIGKLGDALVAATARPGGPDIVLVELGTGNAFWGTAPGDFRLQVRQLTRRLLRHATCVRWFEQKPGGNIAYPSINERAVRFNHILREEVNRLPGAHTVHYEAWTRLAGDGVFRADLLHLNPQGQHGLARLAARAVQGCDPALTSGPFWDVPDRHRAAPAVDWVAAQGLLDGFANRTFRIEVGGIAPALDRHRWIEALWRRAGRPSAPASLHWPDVDDRHEAAVAWAWSTGVIDAAPRHPLHPDAPARRADAILWLYRAAGRPPVDGYPPHGLVDVPGRFTRAVRWAKGVGILTAPTGGQFGPERLLTRAVAAQFLYRLAHPPAPPSPPPPPAPSATAPATSSTTSSTSSTTSTTTVAPTVPPTTSPGTTTTGPQPTP